MTSMDTNLPKAGQMATPGTRENGGASRFGVDQAVGAMTAGGTAGGTPGGGGGTPGAATPQGLPPTGLQQQMQSLNALYEGAAGLGQGLGFDPRQMQFDAAQAASAELPPDQAMGSSSIDQLARNLAQRYGLPIGKGRLVDEQGNFLMTPQQVADASGGSMTMGEAAAVMNQIGQGVARKQNEQQQSKGIAALETGLGQVQSRGRGSLAGMMSGYYQDIADMYANQEYEAADFSYYIQKEQLDMQAELMRRQEKLAKKQSRAGFLGGIGMGLAGLFTGNVGLAVGGFGQASGSAAGTGWF